MKLAGLVRRSVLGGAAGLLLLAAAPALPVGAVPGDVTGAYGPFGFTTRGLGVTGSYGEPSLVVNNKNPDNVIVSTPGGGGVLYWYTLNNGLTWRKTTTAYGGGDSALDFLPDGSALSGDLNVTDSGVSISTNGGETWSNAVKAGTEQDRQWFAHSPDNKHQYLVYHDFAAEAEFISQSSDGGKTWTTLPQDQIRVNQPQQLVATPIFLGAKQGDQVSAADQGVNTFSGPMLIDKSGKDWYVVYSISDAQSNFDPTGGIPPFGPVRALVVAHSADGGATWTNIYADTAEGVFPAESIEGTMFPWGMLDDAGTVYVVFNSTRGGAPGDHFHQYYVFSKDKGLTWSKPIQIDKMDVKTGKGAAAMSTGTAVAPGVIDVAWYQTDNGSPQSTDLNVTWTTHFAQVSGADTANPRVVEQAVTNVPMHRGGICLQGTLCASQATPGSHDRSLLDFFQVRVNPRNGTAWIAYADNARLGNDATGKRQGEVVVAQQTLGAFTTANTAPANPAVTASSDQLPPTSTVLPAAVVGLLGASLIGLAGLGAAARGRRRRSAP